MQDLDIQGSNTSAAVSPSAEAPSQHEARRRAHELVSRFVLDPVAFARSARAEPEALAQGYRESVDRRLTAFGVGRGPGRRALATLGADAGREHQKLVSLAVGAGDAAPATVEMGLTAATSAAVAIVTLLAISISAVGATVTAIATSLSRRKPL